MEIILKKNDVLKAIELQSKKERSYWGKGVMQYAIELVESMDPIYDWNTITKKDLLNGADNWSHYSYTGCSFWNDLDICNRLCTKSEKKKYHNGEKQPRFGTTWLDIQARALTQASNFILQQRANILGFDYLVEYVLESNTDIKRNVSAINLSRFLDEFKTESIKSFRLLSPKSGLICEYTAKNNYNISIVENFDIYPQTWAIHQNLEKIKKIIDNIPYYK